MTIKEATNRLRYAAESLYPEREASQIARIILCEMCNLTTSNLILDPDKEIKFSEIERVEQELKQGRPMQYIIGECDFAEHRFSVREGCLIPRPETEELVNLITSRADKRVSIIDVGCGSGCISITLSKRLPQSKVWGLDISTEALTISQNNNQKLGADVTFVKADALAGIENYIDNQVDIIVSNPPYIPQSEIAIMRDNVTKYEPHIALFIEDNDPLKFYRAIAQSALKLLKSGGALYFEIHESFAEQMRSMLEQMDYTQIEIHNDINEKPRMVCAQRA